MKPRKQVIAIKSKKRNPAMEHAKEIQRGLAKTSGKMGMKKCHCGGRDKSCKKCHGKGYY